MRDDAFHRANSKLKCNTCEPHKVRRCQLLVRRTANSSPKTASLSPACGAGSYASAPAQALCRQRPPGCASWPLPKLHPESPLIAAVHHFLRLHWSPQQIALTLARIVDAYDANGGGRSPRS